MMTKKTVGTLLVVLVLASMGGVFLHHLVWGTNEQPEKAKTNLNTLVTSQEHLLQSFLADEWHEARGLKTTASHDDYTEQKIVPSHDTPEILNDLLGQMMERYKNEINENTGAKSADISPDNGFHYFLLAAELLRKLDIDVAALRDELEREGWSDAPEVIAAIEKCRQALDAIRTGLNVGNAIAPLPERTDTPLAYLPDFRDLAVVLGMEAEMYAAHGDFAHAFDDIAILMAFGTESAQENILMTTLVGYSIQAIAFDSLQRSLEWGQPSVEDYRFLTQCLQSDLTNQSPASGMVLAEADAISQWLATDEPHLIDGLRAILVAQSTGQDTVSPQEIMEIPDEQILSAFRELATEYDELAVRIAIPHYESQNLGPYEPTPGNIAAQILVPLMERADEIADRNDAMLQGAILLSAVESYGAENGVYPPSLETLIPAYLPTLPMDPFTGLPFLYRPIDSDYTLYSAGPDMQDDHGQGNDWHSPAPGTDIVLHGSGGQ